MLIPLKSTATMSSREIAELTGKRHDNVMAVGRGLKESGVCPEIQETLYTNLQNLQTYPQLILSKRDSLVLVARLSPEYTARIVDRWQELEEGASPKLPQTMAQALRLAADQAEQLEAQQAQLAIAAPKVEFVDRYVDATGLKGFREVAKLLKIKEPAFRDFLESEKIMYRLGGEWAPYAAHIDAGRFEVRTGAGDNGHAYTSAKFTPKGVSWVAGEYAKAQVEF
jgi:phage antirepressor YoqD-like protein